MFNFTPVRVKLWALITPFLSLVTGALLCIGFPCFPLTEIPRPKPDEIFSGPTEKNGCRSIELDSCHSGCCKPTGCCEDFPGSEVGGLGTWRIIPVGS